MIRIRFQNFGMFLMIFSRQVRYPRITAYFIVEMVVTTEKSYTWNELKISL